MGPFRVPGISAVPHEDNLRYFDVLIHGPSQSPYEGMQISRLALAGLTMSSSGRFQTRAVPPRRLPHDAAEDTLPHKDLSPEHRQTRPNLLRRAKKYGSRPFKDDH